MAATLGERRSRKLDSGLTVCRFEGCVSYHRDLGERGPSYGQRGAARLMGRLPPADVVT